MTGVTTRMSYVIVTVFIHLGIYNINGLYPISVLLLIFIIKLLFAILFCKIYLHLHGFCFMNYIQTITKMITFHIVFNGLSIHNIPDYTKSFSIATYQIAYRYIIS